MNRGGALSVAAAAAVAWLAGCGPAEAPPSLRSLELVAPDRLTLRYVGPSRARVRLEFSLPGGAPALQEAASVDLAGGTPLSQELWAVTVAPEPPVLVPTVARVAGAEFTLDPGRLLEDLLLPVDQLQGERLARFLAALDAARVEFLRQVPTDRLEAAVRARRAVGRLLAEAGLDAPRLRQLNLNLTRLLGGVYPSAPLARRLLPLRYAEVVLSTDEGLVPPWGSISRRLGFRYVPMSHGGFPPGWRSLGWSTLSINRPDPSVPGGQVSRMRWMATEGFRKNLRGGGAGSGAETIQGLGVLTGALAEDPANYYTTAELALDLASATWPPRACRMVLHLKRFAIQGALLVSINGGPETVVLNSSPCDQPTMDFDPLDTMRVAFPVDPARLRPGRNLVRFQAVRLPHEEPPVPLNIGSVNIQAQEVPR